MQIMFAVSNIQDISKRKETASRSLTFQGTERNNKAFGFAYLLNKNIDDETNIGALLSENYNPQILVPCHVYENGSLVLKGSLRLLVVNILSNGTYTYECVITGDLKDFNELLSDKTLDDINLDSMSHRYTLEGIKASWINPKDLGYVYPLIHNGKPFVSNSQQALSNPNPFNILNYKPAVFVSTILDKIFEDSNLFIDQNGTETRRGPAFNWKLEGTEDFKTMFSNLIIPNNQENIQNKLKYDGITPVFKLKNSTSTTLSTAKTWQFVTNTRVNNISLPSKTDPNALFTGASIMYGPVNQNNLKSSNVVYNTNKFFKSAGTLTYAITYGNRYTLANQLVTGTFVMSERDVIPESDGNGFNNMDGWDVIAKEEFQFERTAGKPNVYRTRTIQIPEREYKVGRQFKVDFLLNGSRADTTGVAFGDGYVDYIISTVEVNFPTTTGTILNADVVVGELITPTLPTGIKQIDFLSSLRNLFNFYIYTDSDTKTVIFSQYDNYYKSTKGLELIRNAKDWSAKIDRNSNLKLTTNTTIPKNYNFIMKNDSDYINDVYFQKYKKSYGDFSVTDARGITEKKDVSVIFSPTPLVLSAPDVFGQGGFTIPIPWIYKVSSGNISPTANNIRILHYNGVRNVGIYSIINEQYSPTTNTWSTGVTPNQTTAALASNYVMDAAGNYIADLHFNSVPNELYGIPEYNVPSSYSYYSNQINELKNANITYLECEAYLNENDINQLDLSVPIFIDLGINGHSYWKVLSINYTNNGRSSTVQLQKIIV